MTLQEAIEYIRPGISSRYGTWADIGAGTGLFTEALFQILEGGLVIAVDKNPDALNSLRAPAHIHFEIKEGDFNQPLHLPNLDGALMANALHFSSDHVGALQNVLYSLKDGGVFLLIEYDTDIPNHPWVPYPVSLQHFRYLCKEIGLNEPEVINTRESIYKCGKMYAAVVKNNRF